MTDLPQTATQALRCSFASELRGDPVVGTAAPSVGMVLIEQPGPWGRQALVESRLHPAVGAALSDRAAAIGLRVLLIRRPGRAPEPSRRSWAVVNCMPGQEVSRWGTFADDAQLLELPLDGSAGSSSYEPTYLVCTHGRHDACCAIRGRPLAEAFSRDRPEAVWECSHVGGDRFAANLLALPHGLYYGRVGPDAGPEVLAAHERGEVHPSFLRGRTTFPPVAQAAQQHARLVLGEFAINAVNPVSTRPVARRRWEVRLGHQPRDLVATVRTVTAGPAALLTCAALHEAHPPAFEVTDLHEAD
ncbi:MAG: sucrase ferredoxin [Sporichthyaceae bacterium]